MGHSGSLVPTCGARRAHHDPLDRADHGVSVETRLRESLLHLSLSIVLNLIRLSGIYMGIMAKAMWEGAVMAESDATVEGEGNEYFPPDAIRKESFKVGESCSVCPWKGTASYDDLEVKGQRNAGAAWYYPEPKPAAKQIKGYVAFWKGV